MHSQLFRFLAGGLRSALVSVSLLSAALTVSPARGAEVTVFAAASLIDAI